MLINHILALLMISLTTHSAGNGNHADNEIAPPGAITVNYKYCGRNCTWVFARLAGVDVPSFSELDRRLTVASRGSTALDIASLLNEWSSRKVGAYKCSMDDLRKMELPAIALVHPAGDEKLQGHYLVLIKVTADEIHAIDGTSLCINRYSIPAFDLRWNGVLIALEQKRGLAGTWAAGMFTLLFGAGGVAIVRTRRRKQPTQP